MALSSTQRFLQFDTVRDGIVVLKGGDLRAILMVSAINFALKSQEEQEAIVYGFQNFLNSLDFDLQILVHSRRMNIKRYLDTLEALRTEQQNELLAIQTAEYVEFIRAFVDESNVMTKMFYVIIPFSVQVAKAKTNPLAATRGLLPFGGTAKQTTIDPLKFQYYKTELLQRVEFIAQGLHSVGLRSTMLSTGEAVELLWGIYNPDRAEQEEAPAIDETLTAERKLI